MALEVVALPVTTAVVAARAGRGYHSLFPSASIPSRATGMCASASVFQVGTSLATASLPLAVPP